MGKKVETIDEEKKSIVPRTAVKGLINGFVAYGILLVFIFLTVVVIVTWAIDNHKSTINYDVLKYILSVIAAFMIFFLVRLDCRLSTFDLFKNCKIEEKEVEGVCTKMNCFYICLVGFSVVAIIIYLMARFNNEKVQITRDLINYNEVSSAYAEEKEQELIEEYETNKADTIIQTTIVEMGLLLGIFSLVPTQKKLIEKYN